MPRKQYLFVCRSHNTCFSRIPAPAAECWVSPCPSCIASRSSMPRKSPFVVATRYHFRVSLPATECWVCLPRETVARVQAAPRRRNPTTAIIASSRQLKLPHGALVQPAGSIASGSSVFTPHLLGIFARTHHTRCLPHYSDVHCFVRGRVLARACLVPLLMHRWTLAWRMEPTKLGRTSAGPWTRPQASTIE